MRKKNDSEVAESGIGVLKIKLGACLTQPSKRLAADLHAASDYYNRACNAIVRCWERWAEDNPEAVAGKTMILPKAVCPECGKGKDKEKKHQKVCSACNKPLVFSLAQRLNRIGRETSPNLAASIVSMGVSEVMGRKQLLKRCPWSHRGTAKMVWQAVVRYEQARPCSRQKRFPVPCQVTELGVDEHGVVTLSFPLLSKNTSRKKLSMKCRVEARQLPPGQRRILNNVISGKWKLCDSELVWHERLWLRKKNKSIGGWFLHMVYDQPRQPLELEKGTTATLSCMGIEDSNPMQIVTEGRPAWKLGEVGTLLASLDYAEQKRVLLRTKYDVAGAGRRGHGRQRIEAGIKPVSHRIHDLHSGFLKKLVAEVIRYCARFDCGKVLYLEPSIPARMTGWFGKRQVPFDWTEFNARLKHKCWVNGIELVIERAKPVARGSVVNEKPDAARVTQA